ncbi:MAG: iron ABC transporter permease [Deltaproteobacteria bacterium]|nr:iron ABC transporter permease [Deltaproteobacteria bacterium]
MTRQRMLLTILALAGLIAVVAPMIGGRMLSPMSIFASGGDAGAPDVFWSIRVPRVALAFLAGCGLAVSGLSFQAVFRNPLAEPFTLGVSSGAAFGAAAYVRSGLSLGLSGVSGASLAAFLGALVSIAIVYGLARSRKGSTVATMLLAGVAVSFFFSSLILLIEYVSDYTSAFRILRWLMGGVEVVGFETVLGLLPFVLTGSAILFYVARDLNLLAASDDLAASRGVDVGRIRRIVFFAASLMIGAIVSACGPIGFVGMMAPHICRLLLGGEHRFLVPATLAFGGAFLVLCDTVARTVVAPVEIPVGVITAMIGGPFFLWLLMKNPAGLSFPKGG